VEGAVYAADVVLESSGRHAFHVRAVVDGTTYRAPESGTFDGPLVNVVPSAAVQVTPGSGSVQTDFLMDATGSVDPDGGAAPVEVRVDWGDGSAASWMTQKTALHRYAAPGTFVVQVWARDAWGGVSPPASTQVVVVDGAPTAGFTIMPSSGFAEEGDGLGTLFSFRPSGVGDTEDPVDHLELRWDFDGDGSWDTPWSKGRSLAYHAYPHGAEYDAILEVRDSSNQITSATHRVVVEGTRTLPMGMPTVRSFSVPGQAHLYEVTVPPDLVNVVFTLAEHEPDTSDFTLHVARGGKPDPNSCDPSDCREGGSADQICIRLPEAGTYFVRVGAELLQSAEGSYGLTAQGNRFAAGEAVAGVQCLAFGPLPGS
jgi:hypothetical protein